jgi:hypothetical protein
MLRSVFCVVFGLLLAVPAAAQLRDSFESPDPAWRLANADCGVRIVSHKRSFEQAHEGTTSEHIRLVAGQGTYLYYTYPIDRSPIIDETNVSLWIKSDRPRLQLMARAVLPRALDERTGKPITVLLRGDEYGEIGAWQRLELKDVPKLLSRQLIVLRRQFGPHVDATEAYLDLVVLNAYGGAGDTNLWLDDLEIAGVIDPDWARSTLPEGPPKATASGSASSPASSSGAPPASRPAVLDGNVLLVDNRPVLVRAIEHRGEPLELLKAFGFNAIYLSMAPSQEQNDQARELELWLIAPPPELASDPAALAKFDRVIAWQLGERLGTPEVTATEQLAASVRESDRTLRRPLLAGVRNEAWNYSRTLDLLLWESSPLFCPNTIVGTSHAIRSRAQQARIGSPYWAAVQLGPPERLVTQLGLLDKAAPVTLTPDLEQSRQATLAALASGARGLIFRSPAPLDAEDEATQQRAAILRLINLELNLIEPWFAGGKAPQELSTGDASLRAVMLQTERSRLVLLMREQPHGQYVMPPIAADTMLLSIAGIPAADRYYHLTTDGLRPLQAPVGGGGARLAIPEAGHVSLLAITQDALVVRHLTTHSEAQRREGVETRLRLAANSLVSTALVAEQLRGSLRTPPQAEAMLGEAQRYLQEANQLLARRDLTGSYRHTRRAEMLVSQARRTWWDAARGGFPSPSTSPCCASFETLPSHVRLVFRLHEAAWSRNALPAGDCEALDRLVAAGWKQHRRDGPDLLTAVELSAAEPHAGARSLRLAAASQAKGELLLDEPAVSVVTGPLQVREGQIARIRGFARIPQPLGGHEGSLLIYDNFGGPELAESISHAPAWREFLLYRAVDRDGPLTITFALHGLGEVFLDDLSVEVTEGHE